MTSASRNGKTRSDARPAAMRKAPDLTDSEAPYRFRLYIAGGSLHSTRAVANLRQIVERHLQGRYELEVVDLRQQPERASVDDIVALPTLVMTSPFVRRVIGDLRDESRVLMALKIQPAA